MTTAEVIQAVTDDPTQPLTGRLPDRKGSCKGARVSYSVLTKALTLTTSIKVERKYAVRELSIDRAEFNGRAFTLTKLAAGTDPEADRYTCLVSDAGAGYDSCECKGFLRHGHCGHLDGLRVMIALGWDKVPHPCSDPEYASMSEAVNNAVPDQEEPTARRCCLCLGPMEAADADRSGMAHADCAQQELADIRFGDEMATLHDAEPEWVREGGIGPREDLPF